jgi:hypothetical protein
MFSETVKIISWCCVFRDCVIYLVVQFSEIVFIVKDISLENMTPRYMYIFDTISENKTPRYIFDTVSENWTTSYIFGIISENMTQRYIFDNKNNL